MFNPFKYRYDAIFLQEEGEDAVLQLNQGAEEKLARIPKRLIPKEIQTGQNFTLTFQPKDSAKKDESEALKKLLQDLIS